MAGTGEYYGEFPSEGNPRLGEDFRFAFAGAAFSRPRPSGSGRDDPLRRKRRFRFTNRTAPRAATPRAQFPVFALASWISSRFAAVMTTPAATLDNLIFLQHYRRVVLNGDGVSTVLAAPLRSRFCSSSSPRSLDPFLGYLALARRPVGVRCCRNVARAGSPRLREQCNVRSDPIQVRS